MRSFRSLYFQKAYSLLADFIDETGQGDEELQEHLEQRDVEGLLGWAQLHDDDPLAGPIRLFVSGIMLDQTLDELAAAALEMKGTSDLIEKEKTPALRSEPVEAPLSGHLDPAEPAMLLIAGIPASRWVH